MTVRQHLGSWIASLANGNWNGAAKGPEPSAVKSYLQTTLAALQRLQADEAHMSAAEFNKAYVDVMGRFNPTFVMLSQNEAQNTAHWETANEVARIAAVTVAAIGVAALTGGIGVGASVAMEAGEVGAAAGEAAFAGGEAGAAAGEAGAAAAEAGDAGGAAGGGTGLGTGARIGLGTLGGVTVAELDDSAQNATTAAMGGNLNNNPHIGALGLGIDLAEGRLSRGVLKHAGIDLLQDTVSSASAAAGTFAGSCSGAFAASGG